METPDFPALAVALGNSFAVVATLESLEAASPAAIRAGYFDRLYLFDSNGDRWPVSRLETTSSRPKGPFGRLKGVHLTLGKPERASLSEVIEDLCALIDTDADDLYSQYVTHDELKRLFRSSLTPGQLIAAGSTLGAPI